MKPGIMLDTIIQQMQGTGHDLLHHPLSASRFSGEKAAVRSRGPSPASSLCEPGFVPPSSMVPSSPRYRAAWSVYHAWESGCFNTASEVVPRSRIIHNVQWMCEPSSSERAPLSGMPFRRTRAFLRPAVLPALPDGAVHLAGLPR